MASQFLSAAAVANEFIDLQASEAGRVPPLDHMKLQKLLFYAHAWWLAAKNQALFDDDIEAWPWGPVVRNIYVEFVDFGRRPIVGKKATKLEKTGASFLTSRFVTPQVEDPEIKAHIKQIWDIHKGMSGVQLSNATHAPGEPWTIVKEAYGDLDGKPKIENELIRDVFRAKLNANVANPPAG